MQFVRMFNLSALLATSALNAQPYTGTIFVDPDIINESDPGTVISVTYTGQGMQTMWDYSVPGWVNVNAYLFDVLWNDGLTCVAMVNPSFGSVAAAAVEAERYGAATGKIPTCLRTGVDALWIHEGVYSFGGGNNAITIHTGRGEEYIAAGILEEALVHEGVHCSLSPTYDTDAGWLAAAASDPDYISTYAEANPNTEDLPETYLLWMAVRYRASRLSTADYNTILATIPERLAFLDNVACDLYPVTSAAAVPEVPSDTTLEVFPSPANGSIRLRGPQLPSEARFELFAADGRKVRTVRISGGVEIDVADLASGMHGWRVVSTDGRVVRGTILIQH